jgi:nucleoside-diphosphate-sugar epimerase
VRFCNAVAVTRVLMTGSDGYIGIRMADHLIRTGFDVVGLDTGFHRAGWLYHSTDLLPATMTKDIRDLGPDDLRGFDALVHLAEISNDPVGELNQDVTYHINHVGSSRLALIAKQAGIERFVHMSSCSVYGASNERFSREADPTEPLTAYATCKVLVEREVGALADDSFSPTFLRNATVYGASPRQRFDLVVNDLAATAFLYREIRMSSDGTPWRPFVHLLDVAKAVECVLRAPRDAVHTEIFNVGSDSSNYQIRGIAEIIGSLVPGCTVTLGDSSADKRNYRADFGKIASALPGFACSWDVERGATELLDILERIGFDEQMYRFRGHTRLAQIRYLRETNQVDDDLYWTDRAS